MLYRAVSDMSEAYTYCKVPVYEVASDTQASFEENVKSVLIAAHTEYWNRVANGEASDTVLNELSSSTLAKVRIAPCSGAFYILNTTVNNSPDEPRYNGIYLKFANLYAESTVNTKIALLRGSSEIARSNGINLCSTWQNEMLTDAFDDMTPFSENGFMISNVSKIQDTRQRKGKNGFQLLSGR